METLSSRYIKAVNACGKKDIDIADEAGLTRSAISLIRSGKTKSLKATNGSSLAKALNVTYAWLIDGTPPMHPSEKKAATASNPSWAKNMTESQVTLTMLVMDHAQQLSEDQVKALTLTVESFIRAAIPAKKRTRERA